VTAAGGRLLPPRADAREAGERKAGRGSANARREGIAGWLMAGPAVALIALFGVVPVIWSVVISFQRNDLQTPPSWVGGANYAQLLHDPVFWSSLGHTALYTVLFVPITVVGSLLVAAALDRKVRGIAFYRLAVFVPVVTSTVATGIVFGWLLDPQVGLVNAGLRALHLPTQGFFTAPHGALASVVAMTVWGWIGFGTLIYLAALQSVDDALLEAAALDGCTPRQAFWRITVPQLRPVTSFLVVWLTINALQLFDEVFVTTKGGPLHATTVLVYYLYQQAFSYFRSGYATAIAVVLFVLTVAVTLVQTRLTRSDEGGL